MAACGAWSGCGGQVAPDVKINRAGAAENAACGLQRTALFSAARGRSFSAGVAGNTQLSRNAARHCDFTSYENSVIPKYGESFCLFCARRVRHAPERSQRGK